MTIWEDAWFMGEFLGLLVIIAILVAIVLRMDYKETKKISRQQLARITKMQHKQGE